MRRRLRTILPALAALAVLLALRLAVRPASPDGPPDPAAPAPSLPAEELPAPPEEPVPPEPPAPLDPLPEEAAALAEADLEALRAVNGDVAGWILIPGTPVSYPLLHKGDDPDNEYYMHHAWDGAGSGAGSILIEWGNDPALEDFHTLLYGHRMKDGSMFGSLKHYGEQAYWEEHPAVYVRTGENRAYRYDVFAAQEAPVGAVVYELDYTGREEEFIRFCLDNSVLHTDIMPETADRFLTLVTCTGKDYTARWVVHAVLAREYEMPEAG